VGLTSFGARLVSWTCRKSRDGLRGLEQTRSWKFCEGRVLKVRKDCMVGFWELWKGLVNFSIMPFCSSALLEVWVAFKASRPTSYIFGFQK